MRMVFLVCALATPLVGCATKTPDPMPQIVHVCNIIGSNITHPVESRVAKYKCLQDKITDSTAVSTILGRNLLLASSRSLSIWAAHKAGKLSFDEAVAQEGQIHAEAQAGMSREWDAKIQSNAPVICVPMGASVVCR